MARILVVDDVTVNRRLVATLLSHAGHEVIEAADGAEALDLVRARRPGLVISDILMPTMDGYDFVHRLREEDALRETRVIFYTAHYHEQDARSLAAACGVSRILLKPCDPAEILREVDEALRTDTPPDRPVPSSARFKHEHLRLVTDQLARKAEELEAANARLSALNDLNVEISSEREPAALLRSVCRTARNLIGSRYAVLTVREESGSSGRFFTASGIADAEFLECPELTDGPLAALMTEGTTMRRGGLAGDPRAVGLPGSYPPVHAVLAVPISSLAARYGWLLLADKLGGELFTAEDERLLRTLGAQAGGAYENDRLYLELESRTENLLAEQAARRETSSLLEVVLDSASEVSIVAIDPDLTIQIFNAGAERLLGFASPELVGRASLSRLHDARELANLAEEMTAQLGRPIEGAEVLVEPLLLGHPMEWTYLRKDGGRVTVSLVVTAMRTEEDELLGYVGVAYDRSDQKRYEESLREAKKRAEEANAAKSLFLANMSHEMRTPMNAVIGLSYLLGQTRLDEEQAAFVGKIELASRSLLAVITSVLDLSKIEAGELMIDAAAFRPLDVVTEVATVAGVHAAAKGIGFEVEMDSDLPEAVEGDATRLKQILANLLANAIKFTERGSVTLRAHTLSLSPTRATLVFAVRDTGIGIAPEAQAHIFEPFVQADASITRRYGGTGLGLSIVSSLTRLLGGEITVQSTLNVGSEFVLTMGFTPTAVSLPLPPAAAPEAHGAGRLRGVRVLVVDDSEINQEVAKRILELDGASLTLAADGQQAIDLLEADPGSIDIVLMDVQMPVLDGCEATRRIRAELGLSSLPIVAVTAGALSNERQRAYAAGMNDFISKPFDAPALSRCILRHLQPANLDLESRDDALTNLAAVPTAPWPEIAGIDAADARGRWAGDADLFLLNVERMLDEFGEVRFPPADADPGALANVACAMHKLRGGACMLGAKEIQTQAAHLEAACNAGAARDLPQLAATLGALLQNLRRDAGPAIAAARARSAPRVTVPPRELELRQLIALIRLLREQSVAAATVFKGMSAALLGELGRARHMQLREDVDNLRFEAAAELLEELLAKRGERVEPASIASRA